MWTPRVVGPVVVRQIAPALRLDDITRAISCAVRRETRGRAREDVCRVAGSVLPGPFRLLDAAATGLPQDVAADRLVRDAGQDEEQVGEAVEVLRGQHV